MSPENDPFESVERGPGASDGAEVGGVAAAAPPGGHPSVDALLERFPEAVLRHEIQAGDQHVVHLRPERNVEVLRWLKEEEAHHFDLLRDVTAVDYGGGRPLTVVYCLWSIPHRRALRVTCALPLSHLEIASVTGLWKTADWLEREVYDMFGIEFTGHPDLRRILMPENYAEGHPLRKDFPLRGRFSRAEQTRRALSQDPHDHYIPAELEIGGAPKMARGAARGRPELPEGRTEPVPGSAPDEEPDMFRKAPHDRTAGEITETEGTTGPGPRGEGGGKASPGARAPAEGARPSGERPADERGGSPGGGPEERGGSGTGEPEER